MKKGNTLQLPLLEKAPRGRLTTKEGLETGTKVWEVHVGGAHNSVPLWEEGGTEVLTILSLYSLRDNIN